MIYKYISCKRIIAKVFTDLSLNEETHRVTDMVEWIGESLKKIGAFPQFITRVTGKDGIPILIVENYQTALPCDFHNINQVSYSASAAGPFYPMRYTTGNFDTGVIGETSLGAPSDSALVTLAMSLYNLTYDAALAKINSEPGTKGLLQGILSKSNIGEDSTKHTSDYTYIITPGYIKTNIKEGFLMMSYQAIPVDLEGYPLVPDDEAFEEAIYWYINMKLMYPEWKAGRVRDAVYYDARRSWSYHRRQAYGNAMMPNADQLESIKNSWLRLLPNIDEHKTFFSTLGQKQLIYNQNN